MMQQYDAACINAINERIESSRAIGSYVMGSDVFDRLYYESMATMSPSRNPEGIYQKNAKGEGRLREEYIGVLQDYGRVMEQSRHRVCGKRT